MAKVTTHPTRGGGGFVIRVDGKAAAWVSPKGTATVGRAYRAGLGDEDVPAAVRDAIAKAQKRAKAAAAKQEGGKVS